MAWASDANQCLVGPVHMYGMHTAPLQAENLPLGKPARVKGGIDGGMWTEPSPQHTTTTSMLDVHICGQALIWSDDKPVSLYSYYGFYELTKHTEFTLCCPRLHCALNLGQLATVSTQSCFLSRARISKGYCLSLPKHMCLPYNYNPL
jgi:hypothetical protein